VFQDFFVINQLLSHEAGGCEHGQSTVLKFLRLKLLELSGVRRPQPEWVKANVAWGVVLTQHAWLVNGAVLGWDPAVLSTVELSVGNTD
jgi:hypothetical protein